MNYISNDSNLKKTVLIVNPMSPAYLDERFKANGLYVIACFTSFDGSLIKPTLVGNHFDKTLFLSKNISEDICLIQGLLDENNLRIVLAFSSNEYELEYSDKIVYHFCPNYANSPETSGWRCNKMLMNYCLIKNGTPAVKQHLITDLNKIELGYINFPLVVKPAQNSAASIGVAMCNSVADLESYIAQINQIEWAYSSIPNQFLIEELLIGKEYIIDMVAWNSQYYLTGIYYGEKEIYNSHKICRYREFIPHDHPVAAILFEYCSKVLHDLDVKYGMMHLECMLTKDGPILIELNPRVSGVSGMLNYFTYEMTANDQALQLISLLEKGKIARDNHVIVPKKYGMMFYLQNFGFSYESINVGLFSEVSSYKRHLVKIPRQLKKKYPTNLFDTVAFVVLVNESLEQLNLDLNKLRNMEAAGDFFK